MNLKDLTRNHTSGVITWHLIPFETLRDKHIFAAFVAVLPFAQWDRTAHAFYISEAAAVAAEFGETTDPAVLRFKEYWNGRPATIAERWFAFTICATDDVVNGLIEAYDATRDEQIVKPMVTDPE